MHDLLEGWMSQDWVLQLVLLLLLLHLVPLVLIEGIVDRRIVYLLMQGRLESLRQRLLHRTLA